jgi:hypothetical protein
VIASVPEGRTLPAFPADNRSAFAAWPGTPGAKSVEQDHFARSNDPSTFVLKADELRQLFRILLTSR